MENIKRIKVCWIDSYATLEGEDAEKPDNDYQFIQETLGYRVGETKHYLIIAQNIADGETHSPFMYIIRKNVIKISEVK